jgi:MFS transporter, DHA1 family, multidrug resistance protein
LNTERATERQAAREFGWLQAPGALAVFLGALSMLGPFAIDTLFPAFPTIAREFSASDVLVQQTISFYLIGFAFGSLLHGALSDALGRKPVLLACLSGFVLASWGCWLAASMEAVLGFRALQGFFGAAGTVISRALVRDRFDGAQAQKITSQITLVFLFAPTLAPIIGGLLLKAGPWRSIFAFITLYAALFLCACALLLKETHPPEKRQAFALRQMRTQLMQSFRVVLSDRKAVWLIAAASFNFAGLFLLISSAPAVVFKLWLLTEQDMWKLFAFAMLGILLGSQLSGATAQRWSAAHTLRIAYALMLLGALWAAAYALWTAQPKWPAAAIPLAVYSFGSSLAYPTLTILLMDRFPERRGAAASLQTFSGLSLNALVAGLLSPLVSQHGLSIALAQFALMALGFMTWRAYCRSTIQPPSPTIAAS